MKQRAKPSSDESGSFRSRSNRRKKTDSRLSCMTKPKNTGQKALWNNFLKHIEWTIPTLYGKHDNTQ